MRSSIDLVVAGVDQPSASQVLQPLGVFNGGGTGTWGETVLLPLIDNATDRNILTLPHSGGEVSFRWTMDYGDNDYLMLVPVGTVTPEPEITNISENAGGQIVIEWTGDGTLQTTGALPSAGWTDLPGTSPVTVDPPGSGEAYYRLMQP